MLTPTTVIVLVFALLIFFSEEILAYFSVQETPEPVKRDIDEDYSRIMATILKAKTKYELDRCYIALEAFTNFYGHASFYSGALGEELIKKYDSIKGVGVMV